MINATLLERMAALDGLFKIYLALQAHIFAKRARCWDCMASKKDFALARNPDFINHEP
jgi:hypothetical protein